MRPADSPCVQLRGGTSLVLMGGFTAAGSWTAAAKHNSVCVCVCKKDGGSVYVTAQQKEIPL